jgi:PAS domain S-box-containing protein
MLHVYSYHESFHRSYGQELKTNLEVAKASAKSFEQMVAGILREQAAIGRFLVHSKNTDVAEINQILTELRSRQTFVRNFALVTPEGTIRASDLPAAVGLDVTGKPYFSVLKSGLDWHISGLHPSQISDELIFTVSQPIRDESGALQAIIVVNVTEKMLAREFLFHRSQDAGIAIFDSNGTLVSSFPEMALKWEQRNFLTVCPSIRQSLDGKEYMGSSFSTLRGKEMVVAHVPLSFGWVACASRSKAEAIAPIYNAIRERVLLLMVCLVVAVTLSLLFARRLTGAVDKIKAYAEAVGRGEYQRTPGAFRVPEFQYLADAFHHMAQQVKLREEALAKEQKVLDDIVRSTDVMLVYLDADYRVVALNPAFAEACGKPPEELVGRDHFDIFPLIDNHVVFKQVRETGRTVFCKDKPLLLPDRPERGITYWDWSLSPINSGGVVTGYSFALRETTQYKEAQDVLRLHTHILQSMTEGVVVANDQGTVIYTNPAEEAMFGYVPGEMSGMPLLALNDYPPEENREILDEVIDRLLADGSWNGEWRNRKKDGTVFYTYTSVSRLILNAHVFFVAVQSDVTEDKEMRESLLRARRKLRQANGLLEQKVLERTRELESANRLLQTTYAQLDRRAAKLRALANQLTHVEQSMRKQIAKILHDHLQQILVATKMRIEALQQLGEVDIQAELPDLNHLLKEAIQITRSITLELSPPILSASVPESMRWLVKWMKKQHGFVVELELEAEEELPHIPEEIRFFLFEAARELLFNAVKHAGVQTAVVRLRPSGSNGIRLEISDNGQGFDPESVKAQEDCQGFGLFSVMERIQLFDGTLAIQSSPGQGAHFAITIPLTEKQKADGRHDDECTASTPETLQASELL